MAGRMWLANANYGAWVPCPSIEMPSGTQKWNASGQFLNGGAYVRRSITGARVFEMNWPMKHQNELDTVESFFEGAYGPGPFYVVEPGSMEYNMFPVWMATPGMAAQDAPTLLYDKRPTVAHYTGPSGEPIRGAAYNKSASDLVNKYTIAVPEGYTLHTSVAATPGSIVATNMDGSPASTHVPAVPSVTYDWTGTPGGSTSTKSVEGVVVRENLCANPSFEVGTTGWGVGTSRATERSLVGDASGQVPSADYYLFGLNLPASTTYTVSFWAWVPANIVNVRPRIGGGGVAAFNGPDISEREQWVRQVIEFTTNETGGQVVLYPGTGTGTDTIYVDAVLWTEGTVENHGDYFDGDTPDVPGSPEVPGGIADGVRQWEGGRLLQFHLNPDFIGTAVVYSMCAVAVPDSETFDMEAHVNSGKFPKGKGSTGMEVDGDFERTSYSAALDRYHGSVRLVEVEPWL